MKTSMKWIGLLSLGLFLVVLLLPAIQQQRTGGPRWRSKSNLKQLGVALWNYHDTYSALPRGAILDPTGVPLHGWQTTLLPFIEQGNLYETIDLEKPWDDPANSAAMSTEVRYYLNPSIDEETNSDGYALSHYAGNSLLLADGEPFTFGDVGDGLANTLLAGEVVADFQPWGAPANLRDPRLGLNRVPDGFGSPQEGGVTMLLLDGSVRFVNEDIDPAILAALATPNGGEPTELHEVP